MPPARVGDYGIIRARRQASPGQPIRDRLKELPRKIVIALLLLLMAAGTSVVMTADARAQPVPGGITVTTGRLVHAPGDDITFTIAVNTGGGQAAGDLVLEVFPAASPLSPDPFAEEPLASELAAADYTAGDGESISFETDTDALDLDPGGYPVRVSLQGEEGVLAAGSTWLAIVAEGDRDPLDLVLLWTVGNPPERNARGEFISTGLVDRCRSELDRPDTLLQHEEISAAFPGIRSVYAIEPALLDQLQDLSDGFQLRQGDKLVDYPATSGEAAAAAACLESFARAAAMENTEVLSSPFAFTQLPLLAKEGWSDGSSQYRIGDDVLTRALMLPLEPIGAYIPLLDLTTDSLRYVAATGGEYAVLAGAIRAQVEGNLQEGAVSFRLRDVSGERITGFFADDGASAALLGESPDAAAFFAALANAYVEGEPLLIAAAVPPSPALTAEQRQGVYTALSEAPWLNSITMAEAKDKYRPDTQPVTLLRYVDPTSSYISQAYFQRLSETHARYEDLRASLDTHEPVLQQLDRLLFTAESFYLAGDGADPAAANRGLEYLDEIDGITDEEFRGLGIDVDTPWLQRSMEGTATVNIENSSGHPFTVDLVLEGEGVELTGTYETRLRLEPGETRIEVPFVTEGWRTLDARISSGGTEIAADGAVIHPIAGRVWIVIIVALAALAAALAYYFVVMRRAG